jgi:hypothetical protein
MTSEARIQANRLNAQKSTGPRTPEGKAAVSQNAVTHGLFAAVAFHQEERDEYARYREGLLRELEPDGIQEMDLAERIVSLSWRLGRAAQHQNAVFEALYDQAVATAAEEEAETGADTGSLFTGDAVLGRMLLADFSGPRVLERMQLYERRIENSLCRVRAQWRELRAQALWSARRDKVSGAGAGGDSAGSRMPGKAEGIGPERPACKETPCGVTANLSADGPAGEKRPKEVSSFEFEVSSGQSPSGSPLSLPTSDFTVQTVAEQRAFEKTNPIAGRDRRVPALAGA